MYVKSEGGDELKMAHFSFDNYVGGARAEGSLESAISLLVSADSDSRGS